MGLAYGLLDSRIIPASSSARICSRASVRSREEIGRDRSLNGVLSTRFILCLTMDVLPTSRSCRENTSACCLSRSLARCAHSSDSWGSMRHASMIGFEATPNRHDRFDSPQFIQITNYRRRVTFYSATIE